MDAMKHIKVVGSAVLLAVMTVVAAALVATPALAASTSVSTEDELRAAVSKGSETDSVKLAADIVLMNTLEISAETMTLDLAGHSLSGCHAAPDAAKTIIEVKSGTTCTLRDSSGSNVGRVTAGERGIENHGSLSIMTGRICGNSGACDGNGIYNAEDGNLTIAGGVIEDNVSTKGHDGAGIFNRGRLNISNCVIQNNAVDTAVDSTGYGGAIYNGKGGNFTLSGGSLLSNRAERGGAVYIKSDSDVMILMGRTKIQKNEAGTYGGAIYNASGSKSSKLSFMAGTISENTAGKDGGGIYNAGTMAASGGSVTNNEAGKTGGGVYQAGTFLVSGSPVIKDNTTSNGVANDAYLQKKCYFTVEDKLTARASIGVICETSHHIITKDFTTYNEGTSPDSIFFGNPNDNQDDIRFRIIDTGDVFGEVQCVIAIHYLNKNGKDAVCLDYSDDIDDHWGEWDETTWLVVRKDCKVKEYVAVRGDVNLILVGGKTLKTPCINIKRDGDVRANLHIYNSNSKEFGTLKADARGSRNAGIGMRHNGDSKCGRLYIYGGHIICYGGNEGAGIGGVENKGNGVIQILGGKVEATGGKWAAGIGGGQGGDQDNPITIENAYVEAYGGKHGAGIGGGDSDRGGADGGKVTIKNSTVKAYGKDLGAGIGGGEDGDGGNVTITNSDVYAEGGYKGAGIGGGQDGEDGGTLTVRSGTVRAYGGKEAAAIGGGQKCCGGQFIAEGGTIFALAGKDCSTAIGAGHKDYHEGSKEVYDSAMVTVSHYHDGEGAYVVDADYRVKACSWHYVKIEPCTHPGEKAYTDLGPEVHRLAFCTYCASEGPREEAHVFDPNTHVCPCSHREIAVTLKDGAEDAGKTSYVSEGLKYRLPYKLSLDKYFMGWQVTGTETSYPDTLRAGTEIDVGLAGGAEGIIATAQWTARHQHGLVEHPATEPTCTTDGNILYWECEEQNGDSQPCGGRFVKDEEGLLVPVSHEDTVIPAIGHDWGEASYEWGADNESCVGSHTCARCNFVGTADAHVISWTEDQSCTKAKTSSYVALFSDESFETQKKKVVEGEPLGHMWGEPTYEWSDDHQACTARHVCARDEDEETEEADVTWVSLGATCSQEGTVTYTATFDNEAFETQVVEVTGTDPAAHEWGEPTYTWTDTPEGKLCTARRVCVNNEEHVEAEEVLATPLEVTSATCTRKGELAYRATFDNTAFQTQTTSVEIPATGHKWGEWRINDSGTAQYRMCENNPLHIEASKIPEEGHVHTLEHVAAREADCTTLGVKEHWVCSGEGGCGHYFLDEGATEEVFYSDVYTPALGHDWGEVSYQWMPDGSGVYALRQCKRHSNHIELDLAYCEPDVISEPSCTEEGETLYTATFENQAFAPQSRVAKTEPIGHEFVDWETTTEPTCTTAGEETSHCTHDPSHVKTRAIEPLGHDWGDWTVKEPATETTEGREERNCSRCEVVESRTIPVTSHKHGLSLTEEIAATCSSAGRIAYWVCDSGENPCGRYYADPLGLREIFESDVVVPPLGHNWGAPIYEWSEDKSTCTARRVCLNDDSHAEEETATVSVEEESAPTCTTGGTTVYRAVFSNVAFETQVQTDYVPPLGHTPAANPHRTNIVDPTCTEEGSYDSHAYCTVCGSDIGDPIHVILSPLGHDWGDWTQVSAPTCTDPGTLRRVCERTAHHTEERAIDPLGHDWGEWTVTKEPTEVEQGEMTRTCTRVDTHTETRSIPAISHVHAPVHVDAKAATCTEGGWVEHWACEGESCRFVNHGEGDPTLVLIDGTRLWKVTPEDVMVSALGHDWDQGTPVAGHEATCTLEGEVAFACRRDGCSATKVEHVEPLGHSPRNLAPITLIEATCSGPGFYWNRVGCERCGQPITFALGMTDPLGHEWGEWVVTKPATATEAGEMTRSCTRNPEHKEVRAIPAIDPDHDHTWGEPTYTWAADLTSVTATRVCEDDPSHVETETAYAYPPAGMRTQLVPVVITFPTCTEPGLTVYNAWFANPGFAVQTREVETAALGHDWGPWTVVRGATPERDGLEVRTCSRCGATEERPVAWPSPVASRLAMYRLYNPNSGEHFYTANVAERDAVAAAGWTYEGVGWIAPAEGAPVYRLYNPNAGDHHYTINARERDALVAAGWNYEGVGWRSAGLAGKPIWREYNPNAVAGAHNFTSNRGEHLALINLGWHGEGIAWYGL